MTSDCQPRSDGSVSCMADALFLVLSDGGAPGFEAN
jgi:hypothetical protein